MEVYYLNHENFQEGDVQKAFDYALNNLSKDKDIKVITFLVYSKTQLECLSRLFSPKDLKNTDFTYGEYHVQLRTYKTYSPEYSFQGSPANELLIAVELPEGTLEKFEDFSNTKYWLIVPSILQENLEFLQIHEAIDIETGNSITADYDVDKRIVNVVQWLFDTSFPNEGYFHPLDSNRLKESSNALKRNGVEINRMAVIHYCIAKGMLCSSARKTVETFLSVKVRMLATRKDYTKLLDDFLDN